MATANITVLTEDLPARVSEMLETMHIGQAFKTISDFEGILLNLPLNESPSFNSTNVEVFGEKYDTYEFVIVRRFSKDGQKYVGGANGEILNATQLITLLRDHLKYVQRHG